MWVLYANYVYLCIRGVGLWHRLRWFWSCLHWDHGDDQKGAWLALNSLESPAGLQEPWEPAPLTQILNISGDLTVLQV